MKKPIRYILPLITLLLLLALIAVHVFRSIATTDIQIQNSSYDTQAKAYLLNINSATVEELDILPGIGPAIAKRIIAYREENGPFQSTEEILLVSGIGQKTYDAIKEFISVR